MHAGVIQRALMAFLCLALLELPASAQPANGWIVWASNRQDSRHEIYLMKADGSNVQRLTTKGATTASWSPDGSWISYYASDKTARVMRWNKSADKKVFSGEPLFWRHDGSGLVCRDSGDNFYLVDPDTGKAKLLFKKSDFSKLGSKALNPSGMTHDNRWLVAHSDIYRSGYTGSNGTYKAHHAAVILDFSNKSKIYYLGSGCEPTAPPKGDLIYHVNAASSTHPDIYKMNINHVSTRSSYTAELANKDSNWGHEYFPRISNDNRWLTYGASTGCHDHDTCDYEIFVHELGKGVTSRKRVTNHSKNDQWAHMWVGALWSPITKPRLSLTPSSLNFGGAAGLGNRTVDVKNTGKGTLAKVSTAISYTNGSGWLKAALSGAGNSQKLTVSVVLSGLAPGTYGATIKVSAAGADGSPQSLSVTLKVAPAGDPKLSEAGVPITPDGGSIPDDPNVEGTCAYTDTPTSPLPYTLLLLLPLLLGLRRRYSPTPFRRK